MKLLFDNNLSPRLVEKLVDVFPDSSHVALLRHHREAIAGFDQESTVGLLEIY